MSLKKLLKKFMDKILKFLKSLNKKDQLKIDKIFDDIIDNKLKNYKIVKLKGFKDYYRIKFKKIRIVFQKNDKSNQVINIQFRKDIYKK